MWDFQLEPRLTKYYWILKVFEMRAKDKILKENLSGVQKNVLLKNYTTYKIGGPAKYFFNAKNKDDLIRVVAITKKLKLPTIILGGGSNTLVSDKGFKGLIIKLSNTECNLQNNTICVDAGVKLSKLAQLAAENSLTGMEWPVGIPNATVGGAIYGNAQAFGEKISDRLESVEVLNCKTLKIEKLSRSQCKFSLKSSVFKKNKKLIIIKAIFKLKKCEQKEVKEKMESILYHRNTKHPMDFPSAGSTFVNPEKKIKNKKLLKLYPELLEFNKLGAIPAGYLIEKAGLAGKQIGKAKISEKHSNFIINLGGAKSKDVLALIKLVKKKVRAKIGIDLKTEIQFVGFTY